MKKFFVIYCPNQGGYWDNNVSRFKGELFATRYTACPIDTEDFKTALNTNSFIEIKEIYYKK